MRDQAAPQQLALASLLRSQRPAKHPELGQLREPHALIIIEASGHSYGDDIAPLCELLRGSTEDQSI